MLHPEVARSQSLPCAPQIKEGKSRKFCLYGSDPCVSFKRFFCLSERWRLHPNKLGVSSDCMWSLMIGPCGGLCSSCCTRWSICCCICRSRRNTSVCALRSASVGVRGGGGGGSPLPEPPKPLGVLRVGPTI
jgi:hypothetical protein